MLSWLTPKVAFVLMISGVIPSLANIYLLWDDRRKPGVIWFILSMATGGAWAFLSTPESPRPSTQGRLGTPASGRTSARGPRRVQLDHPWHVYPSAAAGGEHE
jgi:hypothetical protein